jgi:tetratricopeptide (TPR) repeat protein
MQLGIVGLVAVLLLALSSCVSFREKKMREFTKSPLVGMVYDLDQKPCAGALILVDGREGPRTDINGRFVIDALGRGEHRIGVKKEGYEPLEVPIAFLDRTQVLYLRVVSLGQLLRQAEEALDRQRLHEADGLLNRAEALAADDPVGLYLRAVFFLKQDNPEQAVPLLEKILERDRQVPAALLTLADIYQYRIKDIPSAISFLRQYLSLDNNPDIRARLKSLEEGSQPAP